MDYTGHSITIDNILNIAYVCLSKNRNVCSIGLIDILNCKLLNIIHLNLFMFINHITLSPCRKFLLLASCDYSAILFEISCKKIVKSFYGHSLALRYATFINGDIFTTSADNTIKRWNYNTGECIKTFIGHTAEVNYVTSQEYDKSRIFSSSYDDGFVICWDVETGDIISKIACNCGIKSIHFVNRNTLAVVTYYVKVLLYDIKTSKFLKEIKTNFIDPHNVIVKNDYIIFFSGNYTLKDTKISIFDAISGNRVSTFDFNNNSHFITIVITDNFKNIIATDNDNIIHILSVAHPFPIIMKESNLKITFSNNNYLFHFFHSGFYNYKYLVILYSKGIINIFYPNSISLLYTTNINNCKIIQKNSFQIEIKFNEEILILEEECINNWIECFNAVKYKLLLHESMSATKKEIINQYRFDLFQYYNNLNLFQNDDKKLSRNFLEIIANKIYL